MSVPARSGFRRLAVVTACLSLVLVAVGGAVRATDSGLACPTWPGCFSAGDFIPPRDLNVWLEHSHRLIAGVVAVLMAALAVWAIARYRDRPWLLWPSLVGAVAVLVQAGLGALVVLNLLKAELVTAHLGMGMLVVACLLLVAVHAGPAPSCPSTRRFARASAAVSALTFVQIIVGGQVTGVAAGLAFVARGVPLWGLFALGPVATQAQAYNVAHRGLALVLAAAVMWLAATARRSGQRGPLLALPRLAAGLVVVQILLGVANLATELSFLTVIPHLAVASWMWASLVLTTVLAYRAAATAPADTEVSAPAAAEPVAVR